MPRFFQFSHAAIDGHDQLTLEPPNDPLAASPSVQEVSRSVDVIDSILLGVEEEGALWLVGQRNAFWWITKLIQVARRRIHDQRPLSGLHPKSLEEWALSPGVSLPGRPV